MSKIKGGVKAKFADRRGFSHFNQKNPTSMEAAIRYVKKTWDEVEVDGGTVVQAYLTTED